MSLTQALSSALSGLQVTQANIAMVAANVANANTPGYTRKVINQVSTGGSTSIGVRVSDIQREIDLYIQRQLRVENAGASYADTRAQMYSQLQEIYGQPGADTSLEFVYNSFTSALQVLSTSPDDPGARTAVVNSAQLLAQQLNQLSGNIQGLRANSELAISDAVNKANEAMTQIASLNQQIAASTPGDSATRGPSRSTGFLHRSAFAADGHQCFAGRSRSGQHFHDVGNPTRWRSGGATEF